MIDEDLLEELKYKEKETGKPHILLMVTETHGFPVTVESEVKKRLEQFEETKNALTAVQALRLCLEHNVEIPDKLRQYASNAFIRYINDLSEPSMDECLGLNRGRGKPTWASEIKRANRDHRNLSLVAGLIALSPKNGKRMDTSIACELVAARLQTEGAEDNPDPRTLENLFSHQVTPPAPSFATCTESQILDLMPNVLGGFSEARALVSPRAKTALDALVVAAKAREFKYHVNNDISNDAERNERGNNET